jgi:hypothetical protein
MNLALRPAPSTAGQRALTHALGPWERRLQRNSVATWLLRGAIASCGVIILVLLVGWVTPTPESDLRLTAIEAALVPLLVAALIGISPRRHIRHSADLDGRLGFGDRLATAWLFRAADDPIIRLQREDALIQLRRRVPTRELTWRPRRAELIALGAAALVSVLLLTTPSPQQTVLDQQQAEALAVQQASQHLDALRQAADASGTLTPDQARQLDELLQHAQAELQTTRSQQDASAVLARTQDQVSQQLGDPNADLRDQALAAMSETLAAEPQTAALANALQQEDAQAASQALSDLSARSDQLSDVERQALSRALQRASNVGRGDARSANALRDAAQAVANGASPQTALSQADAALHDSIQASQSQAALSATVQQLRDMQNRLANGQPLSSSSDDPSLGQQSSGAQAADASALASGTPVALDATGGHALVDPSTGETAQGAGASGTSNGDAGQAPPAGQAAENVFVPGRVANGPADQQDLVDQPFTIRGAPRPYRDVLNQYAQSSRDYVDRPDVSPAVRDLVKQYFQDLEANQ